MSTETAGKIYELKDGKFGLALNKDQVPSFYCYKRVFLRLFNDRSCQDPALHPENGKKLVTLKHISEIKHIGYQE